MSAATTKPEQHTTAVIVALPAADDPIRQIGDEDKHATILFFGEIGTDMLPASYRSLLAQVCAIAAASTTPFTETVAGIERLGSEEPAALVAMLAGDALPALRDDLLEIDTEVLGLLDNATQYPSYTPHVTLGYPASGSAEEQAWATAAEALPSITFDRLGLWWGAEQTEFPFASTAPSHPTTEGGAVPQTNTQLVEFTPLVEAGGTATVSRSGRMKVHAITAGRGSSGYYSPKVIKEAADNQLIGLGTPVFLDHPTDEEAAARPARSVRDIAAVFTGAPTYDPAQEALVGTIQVFGPYRELLSEMAPYIGLSIRGSATDITTRNGVRNVEGLARIDSVDFVTKAGRGGKVIELLEAARTAVDRAATEAAHRSSLTLTETLNEATTNDLRCALEDVLRSTYGGENTYSWVRDFDQTNADGMAAAGTVWFEINAPDSAQLYGQRYETGADGAVTLSGQRQAVRVTTTYTPVQQPTGASEAAATHPTHVPATRPGGSKKEVPMGTKSIEESEYDRLTETAGRVTALEADKKTWEAERTSLSADLSKVQGQLTEAKAALIPNKDLREQLANVLRENAMLRAREVAAPLIKEALDDALIGEATKQRIGAELLEGIGLTEGAEGAKVLDTTALTESMNEKVRIAEAEAQEYREAMGIGKPRGLGQATGGGLLVEQKLGEYTDTTAGALGRAFGLSEDSAKTAAQGR